MKIEYADGMKVAQLFWGDLLPSVQDQLYVELGNENGNYDVFPIAEVVLENDDCRQKDEKITKDKITKEMISCLFRPR